MKKNEVNNWNNDIRLDFRTRLFLHLTKAVKTEHIPVVEGKNKKVMDIKDSKPNEIYIFKNYDEYKNFFLMYLNEINNDLINLAIYTRGSKGQIIALKGLCERIIVKRQVKEFYNSITQEQINDIHLKGKLTPLEAVSQWKSFDLCIEGSKTNFSKSRCEYFDYNCNECLMETASHQLEYDKINFSLDNSIIKENEITKKLVSNNKI